MTDQSDTNDLRSRIAALEENFADLQLQAHVVHPENGASFENEGNGEQGDVNSSTDTQNYELQVGVKITELEEKARELALLLDVETNSKRELTLKYIKIQQENVRLQQKLAEEEKRYKALQTKYKELEEEMGDRIVATAAQTFPKLQVHVTNTDATQSIDKMVQQLFVYSREGNEAEVKHVITSGVNGNVVDARGKTPLHYAAQHGHFAICEYLLEVKAHVNVVDDTGNSPLHYAAENGHVKICECLLGKRAYINAADDLGNTPLHYAAQNGRVTVVECILKNGVHVNARNRLDAIPLHLACLNGNSQVVEMLLDAGSFYTVKDKNGRSPLACAKAGGHPNLYKYFKK